MSRAGESLEGKIVGEGRYVVGKLILPGGGMADVYRARDRKFGSEVAIKVLQQWLVELDPGFQKRFDREAEAMVRLRHPNIVTVLDRGEYKGLRYLVLPYLSGGTLGNRIDGLDASRAGDATAGPRNLKSWLLPIACALDHIHGQGYVHRDVKPANILFDAAGHPYLSDLGIAKSITQDAHARTRLTRAGTVIGTPEYAAPEILSGSSYDHRVDQFSLGVTTYEVLAGSCPFAGSSVVAVWESIKCGPPDLAALTPGVSKALANAVRRALSEKPADRFGNCEEFARAVLDSLERDASQASVPTSSAVAVAQRQESVGPFINVAAPAPPAPREFATATADGHAATSSAHAPSAPREFATATADAGPPPHRWPRPLIVSIVLLALVAPLAAMAWSASKAMGWLNPDFSPQARATTPIVKGPPPSPPATPSNQPPPDNVPVTTAETPSRAAEPPKSHQNSIGMEFVLIPKGEFMMGSDAADPEAEANESVDGGDGRREKHRVRITRPFYLGVYEVTQAQYGTVMNENPNYFVPNGEGANKVAGEPTDRHPVDSVKWLDAVKFCCKLSEREGMVPFYELDGEKVSVPDWGRPGYRLPTEAEWEYACRANTTTRYSFGDDAGRLGEFAWYEGNSGGKTHCVGRKLANGFGLYDMHGNVPEWCWDGYVEGYYNDSPMDDPGGVNGDADRASRPASRVLRGGGWFSNPRSARSAWRYGYSPERRIYFLGFRVVLVQPPTAPPSSQPPPKNVRIATAETPDRAVEPGEVPRGGPPERAAEFTTTRTGQIKLKLIPDGKFMMGSDATDPDAYGDEFVDKAGGQKEKHRVRINWPFYLGVYEVTQAQYEAVMGGNPSWFASSGGGKDEVVGQSTDRHPVEQVSWLDAVKFCNELSKREGLPAFYEIAGEKVSVPADWNRPGYRLPTEAEWEYACRANTTTRYSFGDDAAGLDEFAWYDKNSGGKTHPVGEKRPNGFGLYDMHGNVWEWCWDGYGKGFYKDSPVDDPRGVEGASVRVFRGGSWINDPRYVRSAYRVSVGPGDRNILLLGFRLALVQSVR